jgi:CDP-diacylglycerol--glycerol-3-phosphate 3-phosphatidyltransferase
MPDGSDRPRGRDGPGARDGRDGRDGPGWSELHGGLDPAAIPLLTGWLRAMRVLCRPLVAARVAPDAVTVTGAVVAVAAAVLAARPGGRLGAALALAAVLVSALADAVDGTLAVLTRRVSAHGRILDSGCDRVADLAWLAALGLGAGVPWGWLVGCASATLGMEGWRAVRHRVGRVTVWERPTRCVLTCVGLLCAVISPAARSWTGPVTGVVGVLLAVAGVVQLVTATGRRATT